MIHTEHYTPDEFHEFISTKAEQKLIGKFDATKYYAEEITIVRSRTLHDSRITALRISYALAKTTRVLLLHRLGSRNELRDTAAQLRPGERKHKFEFRHFHTRELTDEIDEIETYIAAGGLGAIVISDLESAVDSERHKNTLVNKLISFAKEYGVAIVVITRDLQKPLAAGKHAKGPLGRLAGMAKRILEIRETSVALQKKKAPQGVKWQHELDVITSKRCFGKHVWEAAPKADYKMYIGMLTKKLSELRRGKRKVYGIHDVMSKEAIEKRMSEIYADYELEIKELKARV